LSEAKPTGVVAARTAMMGFAALNPSRGQSSFSAKGERDAASGNAPILHRLKTQGGLLVSG
jgi:hypothetical protein